MNVSCASDSISCDELIIEEAEKTRSLIAASRRHLAEYKSIDLAAMETRVRNLCNNIRSSSKKSREKTKGLICSIIDDLNQLEQEVLARREEIISRQKKISQRGAALAYGNITGKT